MNVSDYKDAGCRLFNKAYVIQWKTIRAKISEKDPSVSLDPQKANIEKLTHDLHTIDDKQFGNKEFKKAREDEENHKN